ncbi:hypothetical protein D3C83_167520 [compost metagenome]
MADFSAFTVAFRSAFFASSFAFFGEAADFFFTLILSIAFSATGASSCPIAGASTSTTSDQRRS